MDTACALGRPIPKPRGKPAYVQVEFYVPLVPKFYFGTHLSSKLSIALRLRAAKVKLRPIGIPK